MKKVILRKAMYFLFLSFLLIFGPASYFQLNPLQITGVLLVVSLLVWISIRRFYLLNKKIEELYQKQTSGISVSEEVKRLPNYDSSNNGDYVDTILLFFAGIIAVFFLGSNVANEIYEHEARHGWQYKLVVCTIVVISFIGFIVTAIKTQSFEMFMYDFVIYNIPSVVVGVLVGKEHEEMAKTKGFGLESQQVMLRPKYTTEEEVKKEEINFLVSFTKTKRSEIEAFVPNFEADGPQAPIIDLWWQEKIEQVHAQMVL